MKIIGISGTNGSGKDTIGEFLQKEKGFLFVPATEMLREEAHKRGLPLEREVLRNISAEWRRESGLGVLIDKAVEQADENHRGVAIASLRNPGEADRVHELGGIVIWVDADPKVRYERVQNRQRSTEDAKTFEQFLQEEKEEASHSGDEATLSTSAVKEKADMLIQNNFSQLEDFESEVAAKLEGFFS